VNGRKEGRNGIKAIFGAIGDYGRDKGKSGKGPSISFLNKNQKNTFN